MTCIQNVHLIGFVAERMKRLEGPPFSRTIAPFFLFGILPPPDYSCLELVLELVSGTSPRISPPPKLSSRGTRWGEAPHHPLLPPPPPPPLSSQSLSSPLFVPLPTLRGSLSGSVIPLRAGEARKAHLEQSGCWY